MVRVLALTRWPRSAASSRQRFLAFTGYLARQGIEVTARPFFDEAYVARVNSGLKINGIELLGHYRQRLGELLKRDRYDLLGLVQNAAQFLASTPGLTMQDMESLPIGLALLHDPNLHGTVADPQLAGFEPRRRAILVMERNKAVLVLDRNRSAEEVLREAAIQAHVSQPEAAAVFSLGIVANLDRLTVLTAP